MVPAQTVITDPEVKVLAGIATSLEGEYRSSTDAWKGSPFAWIKGQASRRVGKIGEQLVAGYCASRDLDVAKAPGSDFDRVIEGLRAEIKFTMLWESGDFVFQQIRDQSYDVMVALGLFPFDARCWVVPKHILLKRPPNVIPQHGGAAGTDTLWLRFAATNPPAWLNEWGSKLIDAKKVLLSLAKANLGH